MRFGVSGLRRKRIENVPNRIENVEGQKIRKRKKRFLRFRWEARKDHENVKNVSKTYWKRSGETKNALKTFPGTTKTQKTFQKRPRDDENVKKTPEQRKRIENVIQNVEKTNRKRFREQIGETSEKRF